jgi:pimeloyl-ACP methyl ester carboxylesterase
MKIVYLHGLNSSSKIFNHIHSQLPEHEALFIDYDTFKSIEESYSFITSRLDENEEFSIIGHSLGGLIAYLIHSRDNGFSVDKLVTLSSPFAGSDHARLLKWMYPGYKVLNDLSPKSSIIKEICSPPTKKFKMLSLISVNGSIPLISEQNDGIVTVKSQQASPAKKKIDIKANHFEIVQDVKTIREITKFMFPDYK